MVRLIHRLDCLFLHLILASFRRLAPRMSIFRALALISRLFHQNSLAMELAFTKFGRLRWKLLTALLSPLRVPLPRPPEEQVHCQLHF